MHYLRRQRSIIIYISLILYQSNGNPISSRISVVLIVLSFPDTLSISNLTKSANLLNESSLRISLQIITIENKSFFPYIGFKFHQ